MSSTDVRRTESSTSSLTEASGSSIRTRGSKAQTDSGSFASDWLGYCLSWVIHYAKFKRVQLTQHELDELLEYSCSEPTGVIMGKRWKCNVHAYNPHGRGREPAWLMGEYSEGSAPDKYRTRYYLVEIVD